MHGFDRRRFLAMSSSAAAAPFFTDLSFLAPLGRVMAAEPASLPITAPPDADLDRLVRLIRTTPREHCVGVFVKELRDGLPYQPFLSALFLAALQHGDPHQVAQVYSAHRTSSEVRMEERLLPLFWVLDRIALGFEQEPGRNPASVDNVAASDLGSAVAVRRAIERLDPTQAEAAVVALARRRGPRSALNALWEYSARRSSGTLGHHPIMLANAWRTLDALDWRHAVPVLQYLAGAFAQNESDASYEPNRALVESSLPRLPVGWAGGETRRTETLALFPVLRRGDWKSTCHRICSQLASGELNAQTAWDAIHLTAADLLFRYKTGGESIGGSLVHGVTATDALRCGFDCTANNRVRLLLLLQAVSTLDVAFIQPAQGDDQLRDMNLLDLSEMAEPPVKSLADVFELLPNKGSGYVQRATAERAASDEACAGAFALLQNDATVQLFLQTARGLMCIKASDDPHDMKYPAAAFDDAFKASPQWRPYLLAASVHALHGPRSADSTALAQAREALRSSN